MLEADHGGSRRLLPQELGGHIELAFYFSLMVFGFDYPFLIGPYETWDECASVREYLDRRGYETDGCMQMPYPQDSKHLEVIDIP